ncbi:helix-turn-helix domain-containing protein [Spongiactinospora sp. 9N601]|uniref:helix-turn-helix domain-containing protein n=1 Tax=Spongiactinospora sp. 9N601 TaxID=3375149 RepID=UPI00378C507C
MIVKEDVKAARESLGLSQADAARRAGISLATWRRGEADLDAVGEATRSKIRKVLAAIVQPVDSWVPLFNTRFRGDPLTPSEAHMLGTELTMNGESFHLEYESIWDSHVLGELPDAILMKVSERPQWLRRFLSTSQNLGSQLHSGHVPGARNLAEAAALYIALTSASLGELTNVSEYAYTRYPRDQERNWSWSKIRRMLISPRLVQALRMLQKPRYAAHMLAPAQIDGRLVTSPLHPDRWWEAWSGEAQHWMHTATSIRPLTFAVDGQQDLIDDNRSQSLAMAWGIFELLARCEAELNVILGYTLRGERIALVEEDSGSVVVLEREAGQDILVKVCCRDHSRGGEAFPSFQDDDPVSSATFAWSLLDLLQEEVGELDEVFEADLIRTGMTVDGGSVVVLPDASGFDLLLAVAVRQRTPERSAHVDAARVAWEEHKKEIEEEIRAWEAEEEEEN